MSTRNPYPFESIPINLDTNLDLKFMNEVPESYSWSSLEELASADSISVASIPVVDLTDRNVVNLIGNACKTWGAYQITNHGISENLFHDMETFAKKLFDLPKEQKLKAARNDNGGGVSGYGLVPISRFFSKFMWSEGFTIVGSPLEHARQLWPEDYNRFCDVVQEYEKEMKRLAGKLMCLMLGSLEIESDEVNWAGPNGDLEAFTAALQLNSYPACPNPDRAMGLAAHTDSTLLTILHQNNVCGLEVNRDGNEWVMVDPLPEALVVNIGDLFHILSNGLYPSVLHRARVNKTRRRISVAYLYGPPSNVEISPLEKLVESGQPPLYRSVTWSEYLNIRKEAFNKALSVVRYVNL